MNELELKRKRIETIVKIAGVIGITLILGPLYLVILHGIGALFALAIAGVIGVTFVNFLPLFAAQLAVWKLKSFKALAAANPIEIFEKRYAEKKEILLKQRENIKQRIAIASKIYQQIASFETQFNKPSPRRDQYSKLNQLVEASKAKYQTAQIGLVNYGKLIEEKRADWEIAQSVAEGNKLANVGEDFLSQLMEDTALNTIQNGLNVAFAELDAAVMDENIQKVLNGQVTVSSSAPVIDTPKTKQLSAPTDLDFDFEGPTDAVEAEVVPVKKSRVAYAE